MRPLFLKVISGSPVLYKGYLSHKKGKGHCWAQKQVSSLKQPHQSGVDLLVLGREPRNVELKPEPLHRVPFALAPSTIIRRIEVEKGLLGGVSRQPNKLIGLTLVVFGAPAWDGRLFKSRCARNGQTFTLLKLFLVVLLILKEGKACIAIPFTAVC